jgi:hypothetical protein
MLQAPFTKRRESYTIDNTYRRTRLGASWVRKIRTFLTFPAFSMDNTWRGASEIIRKYNFSVGSATSILGLFAAPPTGTNFCACISWKPTSTTIVRYKLWEDVGEIVWVDLYAGEKIGEDFAIEIWNTDNETITLPEDFVLTLSTLIVPTDFCDDSEIELGADYRTCTDLIFEDFDNLVPLDGDYYVAVSDCGVTQLIKNEAVFSDGWLIKADDDTWRYLKVRVLEGRTYTYTEEAPTPDPEPTEYLPLIDRFSRLGFEVHVGVVTYDGITTYHPYASTLLSPTEPQYNVVYLKADDDNYYGVRLLSETWSTYPFFYPPELIATGTFRISVDNEPYEA